MKLEKLVPVELRYETIVIEDGKLHIYRDVYDQNTNTEEKLRAVLLANGIRFGDLGAEEQTRALDAVNVLSRHPQQPAAAKPASEANQNSANAAANPNERKAEAARQKNLRQQKEIVVEIPALSGKGYPAPMNLDSGTGTQIAAAETPVTNKP